MAPKWTGKRIVSLQLLQQVGGLFNGLISWEHIPFMLLYAWVLQWCFTTMGEPYAKALAKAEAEGIALPNTVEHLKEQASAFLHKSVEAPVEKPSFWSMLDAPPPAPATPGFTLPSQYLPGFWPLFVLGTIITLHALIILLQVWVVEFKAWVRFRKVTSVSKATHVKIVPKAHRGKKEIIAMEKSALGSYFTYQRRKYLYDPSEETFQKIRCKSDFPMSFFFQWRGFSHESEVMDAQERFGKNKFEISLPAFMDLYKQQLVSPFTVFQLFCVILWCLDSYWQYSVFTLFMIFSFEASVVFQRIKNLNTLKGMDNREIDVHVFRGGRWEETRTTELVPGDLFSLTRSKDNDIVPCDCLLLRGTAVLNEATLTGESIPQMKDAIHHNSDEVLDLKGGGAKVHVLFGGTRVLQVTGGGAATTITDALDEQERQEEGEGTATESDDFQSEDALGASDVPMPPDNGCVCYALRTGFSSSQGKLVRMIEGSTENVRTDTRDTALLLLLLLVFAVAASGYVLKKGIEAGNKSKYQLLLHCVLIITSVIPPELPMQMALAVNSALITLMRMQIFCTEPFRVPVAGKVDVCLFDKTGTLTTDELVAVGVTNLRPRPASSSASATGGGSEAASLGLSGMPEAPSEATIVLGACHALVLVDGKVAGDPIEAAALKAIKWEVIERNNAPTEARPTPQQLNERGGSLSVGGSLRVTSLSILARHHFSSKLQRMSVVARPSNSGSGQALVLVKGSPEIVATLLGQGRMPQRYHESAAHLAKEGMRVLALAYKVVEGEEAVKKCMVSRDEAEGDLEFAGFVAFTCRVRKDTGAVIAQLAEGRHSIAMVTGDALLTAIHVAKQVGICRAHKKGILILEAEQGSTVVWKDYHTNETFREAFSPSSVPVLAGSYDLCTSGKQLAAASAKHPELRQHLQHFAVFARMTPEEKEGIITSMKDYGLFCLMCGDGANDVGALKQAHVGVALLSGFGDLNVDRGDKKAEEPTVGMTAIMTRDELEALQRLRPLEIKKKLRSLGVAPEDHPGCVEKADLIKLYQQAVAKRVQVMHDKRNAAAAAPGGAMTGKKTPQEMRAEAIKQQREMIAKKQEELRRDIEERTARGESFAMAKALYAVYQKDATEAKKKREQMIKDSTLTASAAKMAAMMDEMEEGQELPMVKIGDASVAAPFTSKMPSIRGVVDIIRQGRCTLVTTIQMYQILALTCLISSYSLSVLHLDGVKYGDYQMTALGILMSISFVTVSRSKPLDRLSGVRPFASVFHPALFCSILGQFALHLVSMMMAVRESKKYLPADYKPDPDGVFKPVIVNSVVFLVSAVQQVSVFVVNLKGPPFMSGLGDNSPLLYSLASTFVLTFLLASETIPQLNKFLQLVPFPDPAFRTFVLVLLAGDIGLSFIWDRLMTFIFAPQVLWASVKGLTMADGIRMVKILSVITIAIVFFSQGDLEMDEEGFLSDVAANATSAINATGEVIKAAAAAVAPLPLLEEAVGDEFNA